MVREGAGPKVKTTFEYLEYEEDGVETRTTASFVSEAQYADWIRNGQLVNVKRNLTVPSGVSRQLVLTLEEAKDAAASTDSFLLLERSPKFGKAEDVKRLMANINNRERAIEVKTTRSICNDQSMKDLYGEMQLINDGESVKFYRTGLDVTHMECDGLIKTADGGLLLNEVKSSPKQEDIESVLDRIGKMKLILNDPLLYFSDPPLALENLIGVKRVIPFLSGCDFPNELVKKCRNLGIHAVETNGSDYSVKLHCSPDSP
jgi:hypothetical protein